MSSPWVNCPCCHRRWRAAPYDRLPLWKLKSLALGYVESRTGVGAVELKNHRRQAHLIEARALFVWIVKSFGPANLSYPKIGEWLGRNHSSVLDMWRVTIPRLRDESETFELMCSGFEPWAAVRKEILQ